MQVVVNSLLTQYSVTGSGARAVVCLHGWADSSHTFDALSVELGKAYTVVTLDLPGFGGSTRPKEAWGLDEYAAFVAAFLKKIDIEPYAIVGHSNGGAIAVRGLATGILSAEKLIMIASAGVRKTAGQGLHRGLWGSIAKVGKVGASVLPRSTRQKLRGKLYTVAGSDMLVAEHMQETFKRVVGQDIRGDAASLSLSTLLIYGADDDATPPSYAQMFAKSMKRATLLVIPGSGHFVHQEKGKEVGEAIGEFLK